VQLEVCCKSGYKIRNLCYNINVRGTYVGSGLFIKSRMRKKEKTPTPPQGEVGAVAASPLFA